MIATDTCAKADCNLREHDTFRKTLFCDMLACLTVCSMSRLLFVRVESSSEAGVRLF